ncbi:hypothetical protein [Magnetofaba australis]|uniref:Glycosyltransferase RgtA/B/C/D-like domain-containing protein n=1 Tax=Magnetofaba australis IT-1 TaxID=1434232 RepID=A0A1Y2JZB7_9PROT|nr:hypothetical protein [Magnetofaba australis]OSM00238.1 hypothetical protein MAIT1_00705 [Magnetofaba australis IT-1]
MTHRVIMLALILLLAGAVRFAGLERHFAHVDDIGVAHTLLFEEESFKQSYLAEHEAAFEASARGPLDRFKIGVRRFLANEVAEYAPPLWDAFRISSYWTYAPAQFLLTSALLKPGQSYRDVLLNGRLPPFLFAMLGLALLVLFYSIGPWRGAGAPELLLGVALAAFSMENVIYAMQMESYAIGVLCMSALMALLMGLGARPAPGVGAMLALGGVAGVLMFCQYQTLFLLPPLFFALAWRWGWAARVPLLKLARGFVISGALVVVAFAALFNTFLWRFTGASGVHWNAGPHGEFKYVGPSVADPGVGDHLANVLRFLAETLPVLITDMLSFAPEEGVVYAILRVLLPLLVALGLLALLRSAQPQRRMLGLFFLAVWGMWILLALVGKITLGPTRHSLILLPMLAVSAAHGAVVAAAGIGRLLGRDGRLWSARAALLGGGAVTALFMAQWPAQMQLRIDPFDPARLTAQLQDLGVDALIGYGHTYNPLLFADLNRFYPLKYQPDHYKDRSPCVNRWMLRRPGPVRSVALVSHRLPLTAGRFGKYARCMNKALPPGQRISDRYSDYAVVYSEERPSAREVEFSGKTANGTNGYFLTVLARRMTPPSLAPRNPDLREIEHTPTGAGRLPGHRALRL